MEATATKEETLILGNIRAPRLEDAGLEDCALSPNSISAAFFKAANSVRSFVSHGKEEERTKDSKDCVHDPGPTEPEDSLVGVSPVPDPPGSCENEKGGGMPEVVGDEVGVVGDDEKDDGFDQLLGPKLGESDGGNDKKSCVDGLQGLEIENDKERRKLEKDEEEKEEGKEKPILAEGYI